MSAVAGSISAVQARAGTGQRLAKAVARFGGRRTAVYSALLALAVLWAGHAWVVEPLKAAKEEAAAALEQQERENALNRAVEAERPAFEREFRRAVLGYRSARELLPSSLEVTNVLAQVQETARRHRVQLAGFDALAKTDARSASADKLYEREVPAVVAGAYGDVVEFFRAVTRLPRVVEIREFALTSLRDRVSVSFKLAAYYAPPPGELPALPPEFQRLLDEPAAAGPVATVFEGGKDDAKRTQ